MSLITKTVISACLVIFSFIILFFVAGFLLTNTALGLSNEDRIFVEKLANELNAPDKTIRMADLHPGDWTQVCLIPAYGRPSEAAAQKLGIDRSAVMFLKSEDTLASDDLWGFAFLIPPTSIEYRQIHSSSFNQADGICVNKEHAFVRSLALSKTTALTLQLFSY